jgi:UDP-N-acetylglucosamine 2-epimerase (non-hydrolysing)
MNLLICFGTRPEYIKVKSLIDNIKNVKTCYVGQHSTLLNNIDTDYKVIITDNICSNRLNNIVSNILINNEIFNNISHVVVQGDTTSAFSIALNAFHNNIKIIHLEAGLRTFDIYNPYPEELNRQLISKMASIHLCPTELNKQNLLREQITEEIYVVGNTGLDNICNKNITYENIILITLHRRDNLKSISEWFSELEFLAEKYENYNFIFPMHPNPEVQKHKKIFKKVNVINPLNHDELIELIKKCKFIISDSGGIQEEASFLNKKIIICRKSTERPEVLENFGTLCENPENLNALFENILINYKPIKLECPFGDGKSWLKIKNIFEIKKII